MAVTFIKQGVLAPLFPDIKVDNFYASRPGQFSFFLTHNHEGKSHEPVLLGQITSEA